MSINTFLLFFAATLITTIIGLGKRYGLQTGFIAGLIVILSEILILVTLVVGTFEMIRFLF